MGCCIGEPAGKKYKKINGGSTFMYNLLKSCVPSPAINKYSASG